MIVFSLIGWVCFFLIRYWFLQSSLFLPLRLLKEVRVAWRVALSDRAEASVVCGCVFFRKIAVFRLLKKKKR